MGVVQQLLMLGKTEGEEFVLNRIHQKIEKII